MVGDIALAVWKTLHISIIPFNLLWMRTLFASLVGCMLVRIWRDTPFIIDFSFVGHLRGFISHEIATGSPIDV